MKENETKATCDRTPPFWKVTPGSVNDKGTNKVYESGGAEDFPGGADKTEDSHGGTNGGSSNEGGTCGLTQLESLSPGGM